MFSVNFSILVSIDDIKTTVLIGFIENNLVFSGSIFFSWRYLSII
jgi:hypothetical protein